MERLTYGTQLFGDNETQKYYNKLKMYEDLDDQGRLLILPCAVGDTVYCLYRNDEGKEYVQPMKAYSIDWIVCNRNEFGKLIFTTRKEAEAALKGLEE